MKLKIFIASFLVLLTTTSAFSLTTQIPEWYRMSVEMSNPPEINKPVQVLIKLSAIIGDLKDSSVKLKIPEKWVINSPKKSIKLIKEASHKIISFEVTPTTFVANGSILVEATLNIPKLALKKHISERFPETAPRMMVAINNWKTSNKGYSKINFVFTPYESQYPIFTSIWSNFFNPLKPAHALKGPVYYTIDNITDLKALTDVDMFAKLKGYLKSDKTLIDKLEKSGISLEKKRFDQLTGLYVLAARSFANGQVKKSKKLLYKFEKEYPYGDTKRCEFLNIAAKNLMAIELWSEGNKKLAKKYFRDIIKNNKKHPLQKYALRNLALLMLSDHDINSAIRLYRKILKRFSFYTLAKQEYELIRKGR